MRSAGRRRWSDLTRLPVVATPRAVAHSLVASFGIASVLVGASTLLPGAPERGRPALQALAVAALAITVMLLVVGRVSRRTYHALMLCGAAMAICGLWQVRDAAAAYACGAIFLLLVTNASTGASWAGASAHLLLSATAVAVVLSAHAGARPALVVVCVGMLVGMSLFTGRLVRAAASAEVDALTGLLDRRGLDRHLDDALGRAERTGGPLSAAVLDLDHSKQVDDTLGHAAGDHLLREVARAWSAALPAGVLLARAGGDESVVVAERPAAELAAVVAGLSPLVPGSASCSAGVAGHLAGESASALLGRADEALYGVKRRRRGEVQVAPAGAAGDPRAVRGAVPAAAPVALATGA